jgi:DNA invertase Pin-like site-specific DNA recombinase
MKTTTIPQKVIALLRVSAEENATAKSAMLQHQQDLINRAVQANELDVVSTVTLINVSRNNVFHSPEFQSILRAVEAHEVDGVVCAHLENFIRADNLASLAALDVLKRAKAKLYTSSHVHDFSTDTGIFQALISTIVGGHELRTMKERMEGAKKQKRKASAIPS